MNFSGLMVEEEMEGLTKIIDTVMAKWQERQRMAARSIT